jgi:pyruvate/2-oxoglutarate dehydrogenase complex dihydrolipoamide dehydrogenase (E3) component
MNTNFDAIIIGAGQAGPPLAGCLTQAGMTVAIIERKLIGGTCVNTGCTPTKTLIASAYAAHLARRANEYGVRIGGAVRIDMAAVQSRAHAVSARSRESVRRSLEGMTGCTLLEGHATFESPTQVRVGTNVFTAPRIFIDVGGRANRPPIPGIDSISTFDNSSILELCEVPEHLVIVGGSYIGLEFAQMYRRFGAAVTIVEKSARLLPHEDEDIGAAIKGILVAEGIAVRAGAECIRFAPHAKGAIVGVGCQESDPEVIGTHVLLAVGRRPNTDDLGLDKAGVDTDERGNIKVDDGLATNVPGIWALGDCNGRGAFTHTAYNDYEIVAANLLDGEQRRVSDRIPGYALYIDPPLGRAGMTVAQAKTAGHSILVGTRPMTRVSRAIEKGETQGLMKIVVDAESKRILGAAILGVGGDEAIHGVLDIMKAGTPYTTLQQAVPIHPTVAELIPTLLAELKPI